MKLKYVLRWFLALLILSIGNASFASDEYLAVATITFIRSSATYSLIGVVSPPTATTCDSWGEQFRFDHTTTDGKVLLAQVLAAQMASRAIDIWFTSSTAPGTTKCATTAMAAMYQVRTR